MPRADAPRSMSLIQRRTLALLHEILALLKDDEDNSAYHHRRIQVLQNGFTAEYGNEFTAVGPELTPSDCSLVWDILGMFSVLESSVTRLSPDEVAELGEDGGHALSFRGFDGNDARESRMLDYVQHLIDTRRWTNLADHLRDAQERGNSHMPMLAAYLRMPRAFKPIWESKLGRGTGRDAQDLVLGAEVDTPQVLAVLVQPVAQHRELLPDTGPGRVGTLYATQCLGQICGDLIQIEIGRPRQRRHVDSSKVLRVKRDVDLSAGGVRIHIPSTVRSEPEISFALCPFARTTARPLGRRSDAGRRRHRNYLRRSTRNRRPLARPCRCDCLIRRRYPRDEVSRRCARWRWPRNECCQHSLDSPAACGGSDRRSSRHQLTKSAHHGSGPSLGSK